MRKSKLKSYIVSAYSILMLSAVVLCMFKVPSFGAPKAINMPYATLAEIDAKFVKIEAGQIPACLEAAKDDPVDMYGLVRRIGRQGLDLTAFNYLRTMTVKYPNNPIVLSAFCFSYDIGRGINWEITLNQVISGWGPPRAEYAKDLQKAGELAPKLWIVYLIKADIINADPSDDYEGALKLLRKAVALAPDVAYTHCALGTLLFAPHLIGPVSYRLPVHKSVAPTKEDYKEAEQEFISAQNHQPPVVDASWYLYGIYLHDLKNHDKAMEVRKRILSEIPPDYKLDAVTKAYLML